MQAPDIDLQVRFALKLAQVRPLILQEALAKAVSTLSVQTLDAELHECADATSLQMLATASIRGEWFFPVPTVLRTNPRLLTYYRLLYGFSQKEFYKSRYGLSPFRPMEDRGVIPNRAEPLLAELCRAIAAKGALLLLGISSESIDRSMLDDLALLTLGPQFRGSENNVIGRAAINETFAIVRSIVSAYIIEDAGPSFKLRNAAGRVVYFQTSFDPDIIIRPTMASGSPLNAVAVEIKGGVDVSNLRNRLGEAEKSHIAARAAGYQECWTVVNVDENALAPALAASPTTDHFFSLPQLRNEASAHYRSFRDHILDAAGI